MKRCVAISNFTQVQNPVTKQMELKPVVGNCLGNECSFYQEGKDSEESGCSIKLAATAITKNIDILKQAAIASINNSKIIEFGLEHFMANGIFDGQDGETDFSVGEEENEKSKNIENKEATKNPPDNPLVVGGII